MMASAKPLLRSAAAIALLIALPTAAAADGPTAAARQAAITAAVEKAESLWHQVSNGELKPTLTCRWLVGYALTLCEAREHPDRVEQLLALVRRMQDQDPKSKLWGNLRWYWRDAGVTDTNAVEFVVHDALLIDIRHRDWLPEKARGELAEFLRLGVEGCRRHRVPTDYTNIAILNAGNLIVLGERLRRSDAAEEGYRRLDAICSLTAVLGVHEFCSPTYYGTDLNGLLMVRCYARNERQRKQADALLRLFWTDIAANWFPAAERLSGCHSRSYDYLRGLGALDWHFWVHGWLETGSADGAERAEPWSDQWNPPPQLAEMARRQVPRLVRQHWGLMPAEARTQMTCPDVVLSCCGAAYGNQDSTLVVDLPGDRKSPRCYFIADGREDPYGKTKYETGAARHLKALHMQPFWAGAQRSCDALGLVAYRSKDIASTGLARVQSHFVFRRPDAMWLDGKRTTMPSGTAAKPAEVSLDSLAKLVLRYGTAALGLNVKWASAAGGQKAAIKLVDDGNAWHCLRLTIDHGSPDEFRRAPGYRQFPAGAALWLRVGSALKTGAAFDAWRSDFEAARSRCVISGNQLAINVGGRDGPLSITADGPWDASSRVHIVPRPCQGVLEIDGREVGRPLLTAVEPLSSFPPDAGPLERIAVPAGNAVYWEAESGLVLPGMEVIDDATATGRRGVGQNHSDTGEPSGSALWTLKVEKPGRYWLWARVRSADDKHGKFEVRVIGEDGGVIGPAEWPLRSAGEWRWKPLEIAKQSTPTPLDLPKGVCRIVLQTRQSGTLIDRLMLTDDPRRKP
jgi:hypothetical protein